MAKAAVNADSFIGDVGSMAQNAGMLSPKGTGYRPSPAADEIEISEEQLEIQREGMENQKQAVQQKSKETQNQTQKSPGRPNGTNQIPLQATATFDQGDIQQTIYNIEEFQSYAFDKFKEAKKIKELNEGHKDMVVKLCESVICAKEKNQWKRSFSSCLKNINNIDKLNTIPNILEIAAEHELTDYPSAILYHSKNIKK